MVDKPKLNTGPLKILSVDSGGLIGYFNLLLLHELEKRTQKKISDLFDVFSGISAGSQFATLMSMPDLSAKQSFEITSAFIKDFPRLSLKENFKRGFGLLANRYCDEIKWNSLAKHIGFIKINEIKKRILLPVWDDVRKTIRIYDNKYDSDYLIDIIHKSSSAPTIYRETFGRLKSDGCSESDLGLWIGQPNLFILSTLFQEIKERGAIIISVSRGQETKQVNRLKLFQKGTLSGLSQLFNEIGAGATHLNDKIISKIVDQQVLPIQFYRLIPLFREEISSSFKTFNIEKLIHYMYESSHLLEEQLDEIAKKLTEPVEKTLYDVNQN